MFLHYFRLTAILVLLLGGVATAQDDTTTNAASEIQQTYAAAVKAATHGPADVALRELATIHLPDPYSFIPVTEAASFMRALGNSTDERFVGLIIPKQSGQYWFVIVEYNDSGHLRDEDARTWNADELLQSIKDGTEASNKERIERGITALDVAGWVESPAMTKRRIASSGRSSARNAATRRWGQRSTTILTRLAGKAISTEPGHHRKLHHPRQETCRGVAYRARLQAGAAL